MQLAYPEKYYEKVKEQFPDLTYREIDKIIKFGLRSFFINCGYGGDILLSSPNFRLYCGKLFKKPDIWNRYRVLKKSIKERIKYKRHKTKFDGYYYFGLSDEQFRQFKENFKPTGMGQKSKGKRRLKVTFHHLKAYKILEECKAHNYRHIFRLQFDIDVGFTFYKETYTTRYYQYILKRDSFNKYIEV